MISKGTSTKGSPQAIDYIMNDKENGQAFELDRNYIGGENGQEILSEFRQLQQFNRRCENNTYSIVLSPSNEKQFTLNELREIGIKHLKNLGLKNHQYLMTLHQSTDQPHIHIIANRIDFKGKAHSDQFISKKCQKSAEQIAKELGLKTAKELKKEKDQALKSIKTEIQKAHDLCKVKANTFSEYKELMESKGIEIKETINSKNELQGYRLYHKESNSNLKASECKAGVKDLLENNVKIENEVHTSYKELKKAQEMRLAEEQKQVEKQKQAKAQVFTIEQLKGAFEKINTFKWEDIPETSKINLLKNEPSNLFEAEHNGKNIKFKLVPLITKDGLEIKPVYRSESFKLENFEYSSNKKLTPEQIQELKAGKEVFVELVNKENKSFTVKFSYDKDLNKLSFKSLLNKDYKIKQEVKKENQKKKGLKL